MTLKEAISEKIPKGRLRGYCADYGKVAYAFVARDLGLGVPAVRKQSDIAAHRQFSELIDAACREIIGVKS